MKEEIKKTIEAFERLTPREQKILIFRLGLNGDKPKTLEESGMEFGVTRERIRQIEIKALEGININRELLQKMLSRKLRGRPKRINNYEEKN